MQSWEAEAAIKPCCQSFIINETLSMGGDALSPGLALSRARLDSHHAAPAPTKLVPPSSLPARKDIYLWFLSTTKQTSHHHPLPIETITPWARPISQEKGSQGLACVASLNPWLDLDVCWQESLRRSIVLQLLSHPDG